MLLLASIWVVACSHQLEARSQNPQSDQTNLILATTTSTQDSGLLEAILPEFEAQLDISVAVVAVGTGQALKLGEDGNADVLLVHACDREEAFMAAGHGIRRHQVMVNDFVILGSVDDLAAVGGSNDVVAALQSIAESGVPFVSRGDDSGTHIKEQALWNAATIAPAGDWYISAGQGMGAVLTIANELQAYTLSDRSTYLKRTLEGVDLTIMVEEDPRLFNPYSVMAVNSNKGPHIKAQVANDFIDWLLSEKTQELIRQYGVKEFGTPLFTPTAADPRPTDCER
ncbi:substrate-binding domain-containing protein [Chloroflexi bacterium TSY]|nr:substrate-binding domain-containing protein [Chloroflexi bacterium TSY]